MKEEYIVLRIERNRVALSYNHEPSGRPITKHSLAVRRSERHRSARHRLHPRRCTTFQGPKMDPSNQIPDYQYQEKPQYTNTSPPHNASPNPGPTAPIPARQRYVHLYMPLIMVVLILTNTPIITQLITAKGPFTSPPRVFVPLSAIPTYLIGSLFYPANRPDPTPEEAIRFTRRSFIYRALVLATYGRLFGTPFNVYFHIVDLLASYVIGEAIGERPVGTKQRRSEFFVALLWLAGSWLLWSAVPPSMETLTFLVIVVDRAVWRAAYLALVDDVIGVLSWPDVKSLRGKIVLVSVQAFTISALVTFALSWLMR